MTMNRELKSRLQRILQLILIVVSGFLTGNLSLKAVESNATLPVEDAQDFPVVGFAISAPAADQVDDFLDFMKNTLAHDGVNTLLLRVDYHFAYESYPNLRDENPLSLEQVKQIVKVAQENGIRIIPQINLLGHQSWHSELGKLLEVYPEFDETPGIQLPPEGTYEWPNDDGLYCKSYCPLHPDVHKVVFALMDELVDAFETDAFHPGMDEVFYIGHEDCPRCAGRDKAQLFADEVTRIRDHLSEKGVETWIWGDRLIDGKTTGIGLWEASENDTFRAIDMIPRDVVICDWHYERADPTAAIFAAKGLRVVTCPWNRAEVAQEQVKMTRSFRKNSTTEMKARYLGMMQTVWTSFGNFQQARQSPGEDEYLTKQVDCYHAMIDAIHVTESKSNSQ